MSCVFGSQDSMCNPPLSKSSVCDELLTRTTTPPPKGLPSLSNTVTGIDPSGGIGVSVGPVTGISPGVQDVNTAKNKSRHPIPITHKNLLVFTLVALIRFTSLC